MNVLEVVGLVTALALTLKIVYNLGHFAYTTFLGRLLGCGIDLRKCGPWAGKFVTFENQIIAFELSYLYDGNIIIPRSRDRLDRRDREKFRYFGTYITFYNIIALNNY